MITEQISVVVQKMEENMKDRMAKLAKEYSLLRTGRANPMMLESVKVEYYGQQVPLKQVAAVSAPEGRVLEIRPWDPTALSDIEKALQKADLGAQPQNDGKLVRLIMPTMTEDRRKEMAKVVKKIAEEFRVAVRGERHEALDKIKRAEKSKEIGEDDVKTLEVKVQRLTDLYIKQVEDQAAAKEKEIISI